MQANSQAIENEYVSELKKMRDEKIEELNDAGDGKAGRWEIRKTTGKQPWPAPAIQDHSVFFTSAQQKVPFTHPSFLELLVRLNFNSRQIINH